MMTFPSSNILWSDYGILIALKLDLIMFKQSLQLFISDSWSEKFDLLQITSQIFKHSKRVLSHPSLIIRRRYRHRP